MIDYRGLEALDAVLERQSFERAAEQLHITQSAVSQRVKGLETAYGQPLLIRTLPYLPTPLGEQLIAHFKRVRLMEELFEGRKAKPHLALALNRDSLESWFYDWMVETDLLGSVTVEIVADDQELTIGYFKRGAVSACLSTAKEAIPGGRATYLGEMDYLMVASPEVKANWGGFDKERAIKFDKNDRLHERYLEKFFNVGGEAIDFQIVPSIRGFKQVALQGYGYGLIPRLDIEKELKLKQLVELFKGKIWKIPLYWHQWEIELAPYKEFNAQIVAYAKRVLKPRRR